MKQADKRIVVIALVIAALVLAYVVIFTPFAPRYSPEGFPVDGGVFLESLRDVSSVYIVMDIRHAAPEVRQNILQCGVDFAGSPGLANKEITTMALEENSCVGLEGSESVADCLNGLQGQTVLYIQQGDQTAFYPHAVIVGMGEEYALEDCHVNIV
ncbi:MAG TPA: hypothetical protein VJH24_02700 [Candidatus Bilamarchaeaceae archaeon]|nr:hypothetical protein [Candidatus Bilamarchaeaceae archaeon]